MRQLKINKSITNHEEASLNKYLQDIGKYELITAEKEVELAKKIQDDDLAALHELTNANLRFAFSVAKQYQNQGLSLSDLKSEGNLGLIKAAKRFDHTRGFKFISYAVWWIRQAILQAIAEQSRIVRLPLNKIGSINKINKTFSKLEQEFEREPSPEEIAYSLEISEKEVTDYAKIKNNRHVSMDAPLLLDNEDAGNLYGVIPNENIPSPDSNLDLESLREEIERSISQLTNREKEVVKLYFGLIFGTPSMTLEEIGVVVELTRERVRQIKEKAIRRLRHNSRSKLLKTYLG